MSRSSTLVNAVSVLPDPVGAAMRTSSPRAITGQPAACGTARKYRQLAAQLQRGGGFRADSAVEVEIGNRFSTVRADERVALDDLDLSATVLLEAKAEGLATVVVRPEVTEQHRDRVAVGHHQHRPPRGLF